MHKKMAGRVSQVVKCPPSKREALSSNPSTIKKKKKKNEGQHGKEKREGGRMEGRYSH
jgi:hypothetical protein